MEEDDFVNTMGSPARASGARLTHPGLLLALLLGLCLASRCYFIFTLPYCAEDAYITFRYALHWAQGLGPSYNAGERMWGFTSPLWTSFLALCAWVGIPIEHAARWMLVACDLLTLALGWRLLKESSLIAATGFGLFFALWPRLAHMPASGLESSLVTCLLLAAVSLAKTRWGGLCAGLLAISRPEGAAMSLLVAWLLSARQRWVWLGVAAIQGAFVLYYGQLLPSSVASKATVYGIQTLHGLYWMEWLIPGMEAHTPDGQGLAPVSVLLLAGLVAIVAQWRRIAPGRSALPVLLACGLLTLFGYMMLGVPWFFWYAPTPTVAILLPVFAGLAGAGMLRWVLAPIAVFLAFSWTTVAPRVLSLQTHDATVFAGIGRTLREDAAGQPASVMLEPIGIVGYVSGLRVIDEVGLVTPWVAREREQGDGWYARVMSRDRPDYIVIRRNWLDGGVSWAGAGEPFVSQQQADSALSNYETMRVRADELSAGAAKLLILRRKR